MHLVASNKMLRGLPSSSRAVGTRLPYSRVNVSVGLLAMLVLSNTTEKLLAVIYHFGFQSVNTQPVAVAHVYDPPLERTSKETFMSLLLR